MKVKFSTVILILSGLFFTTNRSYGCAVPPVAELTVFREHVILGRSVTFDGSDSYDPDGNITKYEWDFNYSVSFDPNYYETSSFYPDGAFDGITTHTYSEVGEYAVVLRVTDSQSLTDTYNSTVYVSEDSDNDNLPDAWEDDNYLDPNDANDSDQDLDSDGYNNLSEYLHGADPNNSNNVPSSTVMIAVPGEVNSIQRAIDASIDGDTIVVSKGVYYEAINFSSAACILTSTDPNDWHVTANTIIDVNDSNAIAVIFESSEDCNSVLRGFTITGGDLGIYCDEVSPTINNCVISGNGSGDDNGGGMYNEDSFPTVTNCVFSENDANCGGGMYNVDSSPTVINCVFSENIASEDGAGIYDDNSSPVVINCTFSGNSAGADGGGIYNYGSSSEPNLTNCIFWGNDANSSGDEVYNVVSADPNFSYCDIEGCGGSDEWDLDFGTDGGGNIDTAPCFADVNTPDGSDGVFGTYDDGLRVETGSPCVDAGDGDTAPSSDIVGLARMDITDVNNTGTGDPNYSDIGAYELPMIWFVDEDADSGGSGTSWDNAFTDLQDAIVEATNGDQIWVAGGTYKPTDGTDRSISFELIEGVAIYGGFAGTEIYRSQRDWTIYSTSLSGDIGTSGNSSDNSYHVVKGANGAVLDGFTITGGNADGSGSNNCGGGIYCLSVSPTISHCVFSGNSASYGGGLHQHDAQSVVTNCVFTGNSALYHGGGIYNTTFSEPTLVNCTFNGNTAEVRGGGVYNYFCSCPTVTNCIFWENEAYIEGDEIHNLSSSYPMISYCDIKGCGGSGNWDSDFGTDCGGNIDSDPCFAKASNPVGPDGLFGTLDDGLRLMDSSPCVDAADGDVASLADVLDLERVDIDDVNNTGSGDPNYADMGAYEAGYDSDRDGMPDGWEIKYGLDPADEDDAYEDLDEDGLKNLEEYQAGTDPSDSDTDDDGMPDGWEVDYGFDPLDSDDADDDFDNDGLDNLDEYTEETNPHDEDSDDDGMTDGWEVDNWLDPLVDDAESDLDSDGYSNIVEFLHDGDANDPNAVLSNITLTVPTVATTIQQAIDWSIDDDIVEILKGIYIEDIDFDGKAITLTCTDPNNWCTVESTIIDANEATTAVLFESGEDANSILTGLMLTNGTYGISCSSSSSPTITMCIIEDNSSHGIYCTSGSPLIINNMIGENDDDGIYSSSTAPPTIKNNWIYSNDNGIEFSSAASAATVRNNTIVCNDSNGISVVSGTAPTITNCILWDNGDDLNNCSATYSCIEDADAGTGNISSNPQFLDDPDVDCRLQRISPCINAGDPNGTYTGETDIEGEVRDANGVDIGADEVCEVHNTIQNIWYDNIQEAIDDSNDNDVIEVYEWTFYETINFNDANVTLMSTNPNNWKVVECTIIDADDSDANVVTFDSGEDANSVLRGFTLTGGNCGVYCDNSSSPVIRNCFITDNNSTGIASISGSPLITNNKIGENDGDGISSSSTTPPTIKNSLIYKNKDGMVFTSATAAAMVRNNTIVDNDSNGIYVASGTEPNVSNCILWGHDSNDLVGCSATYSCIEDVNDANGTGNITDDPLFVKADSNNYCLDSGSPCLDSGDPNQTYTGEHGLYGKILDLDGDGIVTMGSIPTGVFCVKKGSTPSGDRNTWDTAYGELRNAINPSINPDLAPGIEIWVAHDIYKPAAPGSDRGATFLLVEGVTIKGGYAAFDNTSDLRNVELYETILSGDIDGDDFSGGDNSENSYHVVTGVDNTTLDGFIVECGNASGEAGVGGLNDCGGGMYNYLSNNTGATSFTIRNCIFRMNSADYLGGGMYNYNWPSPMMINCVFTENNAVIGGSGVFNYYCSNSSFINCTFSKNSNDGFVTECGSADITNCVFSGNSGCAINNADGDHSTITNCTISGNSTGIANGYWCSSTVANSILWDNTYEISNTPWGSATVTYSDIEGGYEGEGNKDANPKFVNTDDPAGPDHVFGTADDGLALKYYGPTQDDLSPCIDAGDSTLPGLPDTDIIGNEREIGDAVDMGAYEAMPTFAHWKLDGNANDSSGNGRNGALNGTTTEDDGIFGDALEFDGIDDYVEITDNSFDSITDAITLSAWITADVLDISTQETIIAKDTAWKLYRNATTETICFTCTADSTESVTGAVKINDGLWHHVVGVYDGSDLYLYIDGVEDGTPPNASGTITNFDDVYIGSEDDNPSESWEGLIDDVRVYDYALDARQVKILFEEASYWRFVAFGDSRAYSYYGVNAVILGEIADAIVAEKAEFVVFPGDLVAGDTTASGQEQLEYWKGVMAPVYNEGIKVMPLRGNHEIRPGIDENDWKTVFSAEIPDNGPPVEVDLTYYLKHRNAIFIALDQYVGDIENHQINQTWLNSVLADNTWSVVGDDARQHVFVAAHEPAFMVQHDGCMHRKPEERNEFWGTLEEELGCRTYFCGHDHFYDHAWIDDEDSGTNDVEQFVVGTAGAELREWYKDWVDPTEPYKGINSNWTPKRQAYSGVELGVYCFGYVVAEVWGESNVRTHWKRRINKTTSAPSGYEPGNDVFGYSVPEDTDAPVINSVTALDENTVVVVFNEWVEETSAEDIGNYKIDEDEPDVANAELDASNPKKVTLTTENLTAGVQYTLEVDNVKDRSSGQNAVAKKTKVFKLYEEVTLIDEEDSSWNYRKGMSEPPSNWKDVDFEEDGSWLQGQTSIGYGGYSNNTVLSDMQNTYSTIYLRHTFDIATAGDMPDYIQVKVYIDDGCIVYINGNEVDRFHAGPGVKYHNSLSDNWHSAEWETTDWLDASNYSLQVGTNIMAIHALNYTLNSSDLSIDAQLLVKR